MEIRLRMLLTCSHAHIMRTAPCLTVRESTRSSRSVKDLVNSLVDPQPPQPVSVGCAAGLLAFGETHLMVTINAVF